MKKTFQISLVALLLLFLSGCSTTKSTQAKPLKTSSAVDLSRFSTVTVIPFELSEKAAAKDPKVGEAFSGDIASRIRNDFPGLFGEVRWKEPKGEPTELIVGGVIKTYKPGDAFARAMLIGLGAASFEGDLVLRDGASKAELLRAPFDKLWAWGGILGASKGIEQMMAETTAACARTVAEGKGWKGKEGRP